MEQRTDSQLGYRSRIVVLLLFLPFQSYLYGGDIPRILVFPDNLRAPESHAWTSFHGTAMAGTKEGFVLVTMLHEDCGGMWGAGEALCP